MGKHDVLRALNGLLWVQNLKANLDKKRDDMKKKTIHIISHSHWDREWYMAYEQHHMRLVNLLDDLLDLFKKDPEFDSFHLDGQTIILDDYLQVRPEREDEIRAAISSGKLRIGPFYILQDDFF